MRPVNPIRCKYHNMLNNNIDKQAIQQAAIFQYLSSYQNKEY